MLFSETYRADVAVSFAVAVTLSPSAPPDPSLRLGLDPAEVSGLWVMARERRAS